MLRWLAILTVGLSMAGCAHLKQQPESQEQPETIAIVPDEPATNIPIPEKLPCVKLHQAEISHLRKLLAEKDKLIQMYETRQQDLTQVLSETTTEVSRTQTKLHRLATQPGTASKIAEVEVALASLKQGESAEVDRQLIKEAQRLLNMATAAFERNDYANAMNHAAQSQALIEMIANPNRKLPDSQQAVVSLRSLVLLRTTDNSQLYREPSDKAAVLSMLNKHTALSANAYQGNWLRVQTNDGQLGWIPNKQIEVRTEPQNLRH
ncbi:SH3 domain-containing protein [Nitrosomonas sp.]|uniref:SH3 domain-containing protein n=1 Tax=Nitrosomonas sp. TaxID=42353 RepID=UPI0026050502|nr:SH3 domain-containing protein [Nitrosomonas sp.]MCW5600941.1 SH3 domain-containing protein [Nitrosomonas sp.]